MRSVSILSICNPLMDFITHVQPEFLKRIGAQPGTMNLIDEETLKGILGEMKSHFVLPGGSGANTLRGFSWCNRNGHLPKSLFFGAVGDDAVGKEYINKLTDASVESRIVQKKEKTGVSIIAVTPDFERTMFTFLGACRSISETDIDFSLIPQASLLHFTGYLWDTDNQRQIAREAVGMARSSKTIVSFDLADPFVVNRYREDFLSWIPGHIDLLFGNREEFSILCGTLLHDEEILSKAGSLAPTIVMKVGARGAYAVKDGKLIHVPGKKVKTHDTTGAGDAFAGGFLYRYLEQKPLAECTRSGNALAASIVEVEGCDYAKIRQSAFE
jgi:sugar/nucleoside kinase (ribokinase family)